MMRVYAKLEQSWPVVGLKGQRLGTVERCAIDINTGVVKYLQLQTAWQMIDIDWQGLTFDKERQHFRLLPSGSARRSDDGAG
jgi:sporulation protein YlmC with PRC-barrel domain